MNFHSGSFGEKLSACAKYSFYFLFNLKPAKTSLMVFKRRAAAVLTENSELIMAPGRQR